MHLIARRVGMLDVGRTLFRTYPRRSLYVLVLMASQAFFYNAIFFTYALVLGRFFAVPEQSIGLYILPFAAGNFLGPLLLGPLVRQRRAARPMIATTYAASGVLLLATALSLRGRQPRRRRPDGGLVRGLLLRLGGGELGLPDRRRELPARDARAWRSPSSTPSAPALGGVVGPWLFGALIGTGERGAIGWGYAFGALLMLVAAVTTLFIGVAAERRPLEDVARPLSSAD